MVKSERVDVSTARDATWLFIMNMVTAASGIIYFSMAARILPSSVELGTLAFVTMMAMLLNTFGVFALPQAAVRFFADLKGQKDLTGGRAFFKLIAVAGLVCAFGSALLLLSFSDIISMIFLGNTTGAVYLGFLSLDIIPMILRNFFHRALIGQDRVHQAGTAGIIGGVLRSALAILLLISGFGIIGIVIGWAIGDGVDASLCFFWASRGYIGSGVTSITNHMILSFTGPLYLSNIMNYLNSTVDRYILLLLIGASELGIYSPALTAIGLISLLPTSLSSALFPRFSQISAVGTQEQTKAAARMAYRWLYLIFLPISLGVALEADFVIELIAGPSYLAAAPILSILAIASGLTCPSVIFVSILLGQGRTQTLFISKGVVLVSGVLVSLMLIIPLQLLGVALAKSAMLFIELAVIGLFLRREGDVDFNASALLKPLIASLLTVSVLYLFQIMWRSYLLLPIYLVIGMFIYLIMLRLMRTVNHTDLDFIRDFLPAKLRPLVDKFGNLLVPPRESIEHQRISENHK